MCTRVGKGGAVHITAAVPEAGRGHQPADPTADVGEHSVTVGGLVDYGVHGEVIDLLRAPEADNPVAVQLIRARRISRT